MNIRRIVARSWDTVAAVAAAVSAGLWLPPSVIANITTELIAFFTIQSAVILPAMIFTAGLLRGDGLTIAEIDRYQSALRRQMEFWTTLLFFDLFATAIVVVGKAANWKWKISVAGWSEDFGWVMVALTVFMTTWAILRMVPFVRGVMSLLDLNGFLAKKSVQARLEEKKASEIQTTSFQPPEGYGRVVSHKRRRQ
jgi:hypothetical protein